MSRNYLLAPTDLGNINTALLSAGHSGRVIAKPTHLTTLFYVSLQGLQMRLNLYPAARVTIDPILANATVVQDDPNAWGIAGIDPQFARHPATTIVLTRQNRLENMPMSYVANNAEINIPFGEYRVELELRLEATPDMGSLNILIHRNSVVYKAYSGLGSMVGVDSNHTLMLTDYITSDPSNIRFTVEFTEGSTDFFRLLGGTIFFKRLTFD